VVAGLSTVSSFVNELRVLPEPTHAYKYAACTLLAAQLIAISMWLAFRAIDGS
jgi:fluoride ion exporter CrcB/FEX